MINLGETTKDDKICALIVLDGCYDCQPIGFDDYCFNYIPRCYSVMNQLEIMTDYERRRELRISRREEGKSGENL